MATFPKISQQIHAGNRPAKPQDALLWDIDLPLRQTFYPLGYAVEIATNHAEVLQAAQESFGHRELCHESPALRVKIGITEDGGLECPPEPIRREHGHLYLMTANVSNCAVLDLKTCENFAWLTREAVNNRLYFRHNFLEKIVYLLLGSSVVTDLHAACIGRNGRGILLFGDSGAGKSTLAYACARAGWTYTSDDTCYLINASPHARVIGHAHRARFRPEARDLFPELSHREVVPRMEGKPSIEVPVAELQLPATAEESDIHAIVYLNRCECETGTLQRLPRGSATIRARQDLYSAGDIRANHEQILEVLSDIPTYELRYTGFDEGVRLLECLVKNPFCTSRSTVTELLCDGPER